MAALKDIQFYQVYKKVRGGRKKKIHWKRKITKSLLFEQKVQRIREIANFINKNIA